MSRSVLKPAVANATLTGGSWTLASLALTMLLASLGTSIANVALPTFVKAFHTSFSAVQWIVLAYLLVVTTLIVSVGRLGDFFGRRRLMLAGIMFFGAASLACGASTTLWMLVGARAAQGLGAAVMMALAMAFVGDAVPKDRAGRAMGFLGAMSAVGTALGPTLGGLLIATVGWPAIFLINLPLSLVALLLAYRFLPPDHTSKVRPTFDLLGSALLGLSLAAYALSVTLDRGSFGLKGLVLLTTAFVGIGAFVFVESKLQAPLVPPALFRNQTISTGFAMSGLVTTVAMTTLVVGPFYLSHALGLNPAAVGMVMTAGPLVAALSGVPAGRRVDRHGTRIMTITGLSAMMLGCLGLSVLPVAFGIAGYVLALVAVTAGFAVFQAANNTAVVTGAELSQRGVVSGLLNLSRNLGLITGASTMGAVFAFATAAPDIAKAGVNAIAFGMHAAFAVAAFLIGIALLLAVAFAKPAMPIASNP